MGEGRGLSMEPMLAGTLASFLGGICVFRLGRRLRHSRLEMIHWLHLTPTRLEWPQRFFKRHGDKTVFLARFIPVLPSAAATLLEGTTTIS
jgi:membrane protein DedA with SNARE-associated domain